jgi:hypothetical protein
MQCLSIFRAHLHLIRRVGLLEHKGRNETSRAFVSFNEALLRECTAFLNFHGRRRWPSDQ